MQIRAISTPLNFKNTNISFKGVVKNVLKESNCANARQYYNRQQYITDPWDELPGKHSQYTHLNEDNLGMKYKEAKSIFPRIAMGAQNKLQYNLANLGHYKNLDDKFFRFNGDRNLENSRYYAQNKLLPAAVSYIRQAQITINQVMKTFSGHLPDENKAKMIDAALDAKKARKKTSKPVLINGSFYTSSLTTKREKNSTLCDYLTITRVKDGLTLTFCQRDTKNDFDFMAYPEMYKQGSELNFDLIKIQTKNDVILCDNITQAVHTVFKDAQIDKEGNGYCKNAYTIESRYNGRLTVRQECEIKNHTPKDSLIEYKYDVCDGHLTKMKLNKEIYEFCNGWKKL